MILRFGTSRFGATIFLTAIVLIGGLSGMTPAHAASLTGDTISGTLNFCTLGSGGNNFTPTSGPAPVSFSLVQGADVDTATFSATYLTVEDQVLDSACGFGMSFTDQTKPFPSLTLISSNFSADFTFSLADGIIDIGWTGTDNIGDFVAVFNIDGTLPVSEPRSLAIFGAGFAGIGLIRQRRRVASDTDGQARPVSPPPA